MNIRLDATAREACNLSGVRMFCPELLDKEAPMLLFSRLGSVIELPYDDTILGFGHNGSWIRTPVFCEGAISLVDPVEYYGFREFQISPTRSALLLDLPCGDYLLYTDITGMRLPSGRYVNDGLIGRVSCDGRLVALCAVSDIPQLD